MQQVRLIIHHLLRGLSGRRIAKELGLSRNTVKLYTERLLGGSYTLQALRTLSDADLSSLVYPSLEKLAEDPRRSDFNERIPGYLKDLTKNGVTRRLLWEEYKRGYPLGYECPQFCELLSREQKVAGATMHFDHKPGEMLLVDFAGDTMPYVERQTGEVVKCPVLICILPFSGYSYAVALPNATLPHLVKGLNQCLNFFGAVPLNFKTDNMAQVVRKSCRYEPDFTEMIDQWGLHNNLTLLAARVRKPRDKAPVESEVNRIYQRVYAPLRNHCLYSLEELNAAILEQLRIYHNRPFQKKDGCRYISFELHEKPFLSPLPQEPYVLRHSGCYKVQKNYHIILGEDWHQYSVPYKYIGKQVEAVYDTDTVEIFYEHKRIALHTRSYKRHAYTTTREHMPHGHQIHLEQKGWDADYFLKQAEKTGPATLSYITAVLESKRFTEQTYNACLGLLRLARTYGSDRMEAACSRALSGKTYNYSTVQNILKTNLDKVPVSISETCCLPPHENIRGPQAFQ